MDRGIKDEGFVRRAFEVAENEHGRWIANQAYFNHDANSTLEPSVHAALVTAVSIYVQKYDWNEIEIQNALSSNTVGAARDLIDRLSAQLPQH
ncbi:MAG: hypothetical protein VBE63_21165 [Lamprobacter sp.]|uniref:hypothetical protein n=1 Tax=Lamprobacter sp. TaxID=3100796 RepID=UPI002B264370|nr:hypothetical protein [Lamprobacter sp.]MEA3642431.1 hypothetical protein [Lamprobacter sp.]